MKANVPLRLRRVNLKRTETNNKLFFFCNYTFNVYISVVAVYLYNFKHVMRKKLSPTLASIIKEAV